MTVSRTRTRVDYHKQDKRKKYIFISVVFALAQRSSAVDSNASKPIQCEIAVEHREYSLQKLRQIESVQKTKI